MMAKREWAALLILGGLILLATLAVGYGWQRQGQTILVAASMPEAGGWKPGDIQALAGQPLHLRLTSRDVTHGFAVGKMNLPAVDIEPGEVSEVTLTFDEPGKYTYYCTRWCGPNHWRMRGTIEVLGNGNSPVSQVPGPPLYVELGLDIDAPHPAAVTPAGRPGSDLARPELAALPVRYRSQSYFRRHSPAEAWQDLRADDFTRELSDDQVWGLVAVIWRANTSEEKLELGRQLYAENCAACHGQGGAGDGPMAKNWNQTLQAMKEHEVAGAEMAAAQGAPAGPADFTDPASMLGASPAILNGKIIRGGMGTGMPYWGPIFTEEQIWALVDYLWTFQFDYDYEVNHE